MFAELRAARHLPAAEEESELTSPPELSGTEKALIRAHSAAAQGQNAAAAGFLQQAFEGLPMAPWTPAGMLRRGITLAQTVADAEPALARPLFDALDTPFPAGLFDAGRLAARRNLARHLPFAEVCLQVFEPYEPHPIWQIDFLDRRANCYTQIGDPRAATAQSDADRLRRRHHADFSNQPQMTKGNLP